MGVFVSRGKLRHQEDEISQWRKEIKEKDAEIQTLKRDLEKAQENAEITDQAMKIKKNEIEDLSGEVLNLKEKIQVYEQENSNQLQQQQNDEDEEPNTLQHTKMENELKEELTEIIHANMNEEDLARLFVLYREYCQRIRQNPSNTEWVWEKGTLEKEFNRKYRDTNQYASDFEEKSTAHHDEFLRKLGCNDNPEFASDAVDLEKDSDEERITQYLQTQIKNLEECDKERVDELCTYIQNDDESNDSVRQEIHRIHKSLLKAIEKLNGKYKGKMKKMIKDQNQMKELLLKYRSKQKEKLMKRDEERLKDLKPKANEEDKEFIRYLLEKLSDKELEEESFKEDMMEQLHIREVNEEKRRREMLASFKRRHSVNIDDIIENGNRNQSRFGNIING